MTQTRKVRTGKGMPRSAKSLEFPKRVVVAVPANGETLFRLVEPANDAESYCSRVAREKPVYPDGPAVLWAGVSMWATKEMATSRSRRDPLVVARVKLTKGLGFYVAKTHGDGHFTVWGDPQRLQECSRVVVREGSK